MHTVFCEPPGIRSRRFFCARRRPDHHFLASMQNFRSRSVLIGDNICYNQMTYKNERVEKQGDSGMRVLGIDPGIATMGFGFVDKVGHKLVPVQFGCIQTEAGLPQEVRLKQIYEASCRLLDQYKPDTVGVEKLFFNKNVTNAFSVGQARGVLLLAAAQRGLPIGEYTPMQVKQAVVGYGGAEKKQVQEMVRMFLKLAAAPKPDDVADALAVAICHAHAYVLTDKLNGVKPS